MSVIELSWTAKNMALKDEMINIAAPEKRHGPITGIEEIPKMQICFDLSNNTVSCDQRWNLVWRKRWRSWWWEQRTGSLWATLITWERFSNISKYDQILKYSNIIKYYQRSSSLWATLITCEGLSNIFKYDQVFKYTNIQILSKKRQSLGNTHHLWGIVKYFQIWSSIQIYKYSNIIKEAAVSG